MIFGYSFNLVYIVRMSIVLPHPTVPKSSLGYNSTHTTYSKACLTTLCRSKPKREWGLVMGYCVYISLIKSKIFCRRAYIIFCTLGFQRHQY